MVSTKFKKTKSFLSSSPCTALVAVGLKGVNINKSGGGQLCANIFCHSTPPGDPRRRKNLKNKFKTFGFSDIRHKFKILLRYTNYLANTTLSLLQTKLAEKTCLKNIHIYIICSVSVQLY